MFNPSLVVVGERTPLHLIKNVILAQKFQKYKSLSLNLKLNEFDHLFRNANTEKNSILLDPEYWKKKSLAGVQLIPWAVDVKDELLLLLLNNIFFSLDNLKQEIISALSIRLFQIVFEVISEHIDVQYWINQVDINKLDSNEDLTNIGFSEEFKEKNAKEIESCMASVNEYDVYQLLQNLYDKSLQSNQSTSNIPTLLDDFTICDNYNENPKIEFDDKLKNQFQQSLSEYYNNWYYNIRSSGYPLYCRETDIKWWEFQNIEKMTVFSKFLSNYANSSTSLPLFLEMVITNCNQSDDNILFDQNNVHSNFSNYPNGSNLMHLFKLFGEKGSKLLHTLKYLWPTTPHPLILLDDNEIENLLNRCKILLLDGNITDWFLEICETYKIQNKSIVLTELFRRFEISSYSILAFSLPMFLILSQGTDQNDLSEEKKQLNDKINYLYTIPISSRIQIISNIIFDFNIFNIYYHDKLLPLNNNYIIKTAEILLLTKQKSILINRFKRNILTFPPNNDILHNHIEHIKIFNIKIDSYYPKLLANFIDKFCSNCGQIPAEIAICLRVISF